ncbi:MAG: hypothetical protein M3277_11925 [Actinomycetota bacterium]|nr:hypothetical protein [Actinomycetota bacterium]
MKSIVISGTTFPKAVSAELQARGFEIVSIPGDLDEESVVERLEGAWGYILGGSETMTKGVWGTLSDLRLVCFLGTGFESFIELPTDRERIAFCYTPHANAEAVAEFTIALMLDAVRGVCKRTMGVAGGVWSEESTPSLIGASIGIIGMGHIGQSVARIATAAFGSQIVYWNRSRKPELESLGYTRLDTPTDVCRSASIVSLHCAYVPGANDALIGEAELQALGAGGVLVNTARAELVDPGSLAKALRSGGISGAAFDGYYTEPTPLPTEDVHGLLSLIPESLLVTPHCAYLSEQAVLRMAEMAAANIVAVEAGQAPPFAIAS